MGRILVVDDEPGIITLVRTVLKKEGHVVLGAASGEEALEMLKEEKPDLILLDIMMPRLDGWETLARIREQEHLRDVPVSMLTAKSLTPETVARPDIEQLIDYIQKPFTRQSLIEKVNLILSRLQRLSENEAAPGAGADSLFKEYTDIVKAEWLHESLLETLQQGLKGIDEPYEIEVAKEAIASEQLKLDELKKKRKEIEKRIREK
ncbi:MAG: response regulator [Methanobacteriota archaeon]|nr:MAG: response regulator [Euryarchaeota archaeon]